MSDTQSRCRRSKLRRSNAIAIGGHLGGCHRGGLQVRTADRPSAAAYGCDCRHFPWSNVLAVRKRLGEAVSPSCRDFSVLTKQPKE